MRIIFAEPFDDQAVSAMSAFGEVVVLDRCDEAALMAAAPGCHALLIRTYSQVTRAVLDRADSLRVIGRAGVGLENVDVETAKARGVAVVYTPYAATQAVADFSVGLMLNLNRRIAAGERYLRAGRFAEGRNSSIGDDLCNKTIGIIGMGRIGRAVGHRCAVGFGMNVVYYDIVEIVGLSFAARAVPFEEVIAASHFVSLHVPLTEQSHDMINAAALRKFRSDTVLINTARGAVVDSRALAAALVDQTIAGAAIDVTCPEPLPIDHPLLSAPNLIITPHIAARSASALRRMNEVVDDVGRVLAGLPPLYPA